MDREKEIDLEIERLQKEKEEIRRRKMFTCEHCGKKTKVSNLILINEYFYENGFQYLKEHKIYCKKCKQFSRGYLLNHDKKDHTKGFTEDNLTDEALEKSRVKNYLFIKKYQYNFGETLTSYGDQLETLTLDELRRKNEEYKNDPFSFYY